MSKQRVCAKADVPEGEVRVVANPAFELFQRIETAFIADLAL